MLSSYEGESGATEMNISTEKYGDVCAAVFNEHHCACSIHDEGSWLRQPSIRRHQRSYEDDCLRIPGLEEYLAEEQVHSLNLKCTVSCCLTSLHL
jgi:hypothetical protein